MNKYDEEIDRYQMAFERANGERRYEITYERGWFLFKSPSMATYRYRKADLEQMTKALEHRYDSREA